MDILRAAWHFDFWTPAQLSFTAKQEKDSMHRTVGLLFLTPEFFSEHVFILDAFRGTGANASCGAVQSCDRCERAPRPHSARGGADWEALGGCRILWLLLPIKTLELPALTQVCKQADWSNTSLLSASCMCAQASVVRQPLL